MAKLSAGILSQPRGKVAGVVGASWKGIGYVRAKVVPANPNTAAQQAQRSKMSVVVKAAQYILATILIPYVTPFQKKMSGYNWFCKANISGVVGTALGADIKITAGTEVAPVLAAVAPGTNPTISGTFTPVAVTASGETDYVGIAIYHKAANSFTFWPATVDAAAKTFTVTTTGESVAADDTVLSFYAVNKTGLAAQKVSNSSGVTVA